MPAFLTLPVSPMKYLLMLAVLLVVKKCNHTDRFPILYNATRQHWSGGAAGSGHGFNFNVYLDGRTAHGIAFDSLWVDDGRFAVKPVPGSKGDTLQLFAEEYIRSQWMKNHEPDPSAGPAKLDTIPFPITYNGLALLGYRLNGKRGFVLIGKFTILPPLNYP